MKTSILPDTRDAIDFEDLFRAPRPKYAEHIVARVRGEMDRIAHSLSPRAPVVVTSLEPDDYLAEGVLVDWEAIAGPVAFFLMMLGAWEVTGSGERRKAVTVSARNLVRVWETMIKSGVLECLYGRLYIEPQPEDHASEVRESVRQLVLQGHLMDSGRRVRGEVVWVAASACTEA